jgi:hypothetical protein
MMKILFPPLSFPNERLALRTIETMKKVRHLACDLKVVAQASSCVGLEKQWVFESVEKLELLTYEMILDIQNNNNLSIVDDTFTEHALEELRAAVSTEIAEYDMASVTWQQIQDAELNPCVDEESAKKCLRIYTSIEQCLNAYCGKIRRLRCRRNKKVDYVIYVGFLLSFCAEGKFGFYLYHKKLIPDKFWRSVVQGYRRDAEKNLREIVG